MNPHSLLSEISFAEISKNPALYGRLVAYLDAALNGLPEKGYVHGWITSNLARDVAKIKESR